MKKEWPFCISNVTYQTSSRNCSQNITFEKQVATRSLEQKPWFLDVSVYIQTLHVFVFFCFCIATNDCRKVLGFRIYCSVNQIQIDWLPITINLSRPILIWLTEQKIWNLTERFEIESRDTMISAVMSLIRI